MASLDDPAMLAVLQHWLVTCTEFDQAHAEQAADSDILALAERKTIARLRLCAQLVAAGWQAPEGERRSAQHQRT